ncbi:hypothetical protein LIER_43415 [Lithospermum erythrorhizon]|uniref:DUF8018 domain-containing protein n=1 Tax=Lithospermum erythrorhizon TaxID=34254 RepID=A0AAV3Q368_LITER
MDRGDCIESIQRRLLSKSAFPSYEEIYFSQIEAEDLFRMQVDIIHKMSVLDPIGDWMGRRARNELIRDQQVLRKRTE